MIIMLNMSKNEIIKVILNPNIASLNDFLAIKFNKIFNKRDVTLDVIENQVSFIL